MAEGRIYDQAPRFVDMHFGGAGHEPYPPTHTHTHIHKNSTLIITQKHTHTHVYTQHATHFHPREKPGERYYGQGAQQLDFWPEWSVGEGGGDY